MCGLHPVAESVRVQACHMEGRELEFRPSQTNYLQNGDLLLLSLAFNNNRIGTRIIGQREKPGHDANRLVSPWVSTIKSPWRRTSQINEYSIVQFILRLSYPAVALS